MRLKKLMLAAAAVSMTASPVLAANTAPLQSVSSTSARASADEGKSELFGGGGFIVAALAAAAVIIAIIIIADNDDDPNSP